MLNVFAAIHPMLATVWVVWFFVLFGGIVLYVMAPHRKHGYERAGDIPLRDEPQNRKS